MSTTVDPPAPVTSPVRLGRRSVGALGVLALALGTLQSVVEPALPELQRELGISPAEGALVANVLLITGAVLAPVAGKLGDRYGGRRVLLWLMTVVSAGGLMAGLAPNLPALLLGQILQGVMVGALPLSFILVRRHLSTGESQAAMGVVLALFTGGGIIGMSVAGPIAHALSWQWIFVLPTIAIIAATAAVARWMPHDPPASSGHRIDWPGMALLSATLLALMLGLVTVTGGDLPPLAAVGVVVAVAALATAWVAVERRAAAPMVDLRLLAAPAMRGAIGLTFLMSVTFGMVVILLPQMFAAPGDGYGFGLSTTDIGLLLLPGAIAGAVSDSVAGIAGRRFGARAVVVASIVVTAATMIALAWVHDAAWQLAVAKVLAAFAAGAGTTALLASTASAVRAGDTGVTTGLLVVTRLVGTIVGAQTGGAVLVAGAGASAGVPAEWAFVTGFVIAGTVAALSLFAVRTTKGAPA